MACGTRFKCTGASYLLVILFYCSAPLLPVLFASGAIAADTQQPATHHAHPNHHHGLSHHHRSINLTWSSRSQHAYHNRHKHEPVPHYRSYQTSTRSPPPTTTTTTTTSSSTSASVIKSGDSKQAASNVYQRLSAQESSAGRSIVYGGTVHHHRPPTQQQRELGGGGGFGGVLGPIYPNGVMTTTTSYNKYHPGRRVCSDFTSTQPQHQPQQQQQHQRNNNRSPRLVYADNQQQQQPQPGFLQCCPGWTQVSPLSYGCNKPVCLVACQNGGVCSSPGRCSCPKGFTGNYCQTDVDECETEKPCDQICRNVPGSYECYCRSGYELQPDRTSCRKNDSDGTALEARDLEFDYEEATTPNTRRTSGHRDTENEVSEGEGEPEETSYVELLRRLIKLEKQFAKGKKRETEANEIAARIASAIDSINEIRRSIQNMQLMQREVYELRNKVKLYEFETRKIQHLNNRVVDLENQLRLRCRTNVFFNRGSALY